MRVVWGYGGDNQNKHHVDYDGIGVTVVLASSLFPYALQHTHLPDRISNTARAFWDGNFISTTPLREVLQYHRDFWLNYFRQSNIDYDDGTLEKKDKQKLPNLEVYIVNLYPSLENYLPTDLDSIRDREIDIKFHDRTKYDEQVANIVTDYIGLVRSAMDLALSQAKDKKLLRDEFTRLLKTGGLISRGRFDKSRTYQDLLEGRFKVKVHRIDRRNDSNTIFGKYADFSSTTIDELIKKEERKPVHKSVKSSFIYLLANQNGMQSVDGSVCLHFLDNLS